MATLTAKQKAERAKAAAAKKTAPEASTIEAPAVSTPKPAGVKTAGRTVVVVSKMPRGLYLDIFKPITQAQRVMGGGVQNVTVNMRMPERIRIKPAVLAYGLIPNYPIVDGFSFTRDVPADHWRTYREQNSQLQLITEGLLAAFDDEASAIAYCKEHGKKTHGLEPIAQEGDKRIEHSLHSNVTDVEIDSDSVGTRKVA